MALTSFTVEAPAPLPPALADLPVHIRIDDGDGLPAAATLRFRDPERLFLHESKIRIGGPLNVLARGGMGGSAPVRLFCGEVVALEAEFDGTGSFTTVRALDRGHRLQRGRRVAGYPNQTAADIAREIADRAGLRIGTIDPTPTTYPLATQANITDWEFLHLLAAENGRQMEVVDGVFHFRRPPPADTAPSPGLPGAAHQNPYILSLTENVMAIRSHLTSVGQVARVQVRGWSVAEKRALLGESTVKRSSGALAGLDSSAADVFGAVPLTVTDVTYGSVAEVQAASQSLAEDIAAGFAELDVVVRGDPRLRAGVAIALTGAGEPFDGKYTVTASQHVDRPGLGYETRLTVGTRPRTQSQSQSQSKAAHTATAPRIPGVAIGIVTNTKAPENLRDQGWVQLRFPWLSGDAEGEQYVSDWVRTVQAGGFGGGGVISPDVGDEVLVAFDQGLLDRPYVIGGLYNGRDRPSPHDIPLVDNTEGKVVRSSLANRAGDRVELLDSDRGPQGTRLRTGDDKLVLHLDRKQTAVTVHSDGAVTVTAAGSVSIQGRNGISLDAGTGDLTLSGGNVSVSGTSVAVQGRSECAVKAPVVKIN